jgi:hypothetical protein
LHDVEPAAATDHQHTGAGRDSGVPDNGANAGGDAASDDRCVGERQAFADRHDLLGRADDLFRESADASHLIEGFAVQFNPRGAVMHPPAWGIVVPNAEYRLPRRAVAAMAAMPKEKMT